MSLMSFVLYKAQLERGQSKSWDSCVEVVAKFQHFEEFKRSYHNNRPSLLKIDYDFHFFKEGFLPDWCHPANQHGGRYVLANLEQQNDEDFNQLWLNVVEFIMRSESLAGGAGVVGALVKVRGMNGYKRTISIWMGSASTMITRTLISAKLKEKLKLDHIFFGLHADLEQKSKCKKAKRMQLELMATTSPPPIMPVRAPPPVSWRDRPNSKPSVAAEAKSWRRKE